MSHINKEYLDKIYARQQVSCVEQECHRLLMLLEDSVKKGQREYVLKPEEGYLMEEYFSDIELYFNPRHIQISKKYKKTDDGRTTIYTISI